MKKTKNGTVYCEEFSNSHDFVKHLTKEERQKQIRNVVEYYMRRDYRDFEEVCYNEDLNYGIDIHYTFKTDGASNYVFDKIIDEIKRIIKGKILKIWFHCSFNQKQITMSIYDIEKIPYSEL